MERRFFSILALCWLGIGSGRAAAQPPPSADRPPPPAHHQAPQPGDAFGAPPPILGAPAPPPGQHAPVLTREGQIQLFVHTVADQEGIPPGPGREGMLNFFRARRVAIARGGPGGYQFVVGRLERVVSESAFISSFTLVTRSSELDRYKPSDSKRTMGQVLLVGGGATAYVAGLLAMTCLTPSNPEYAGSTYREERSCSAGTRGAVALGGLVAAVAGIVLISQSNSDAANPAAHNIPVGTADLIVQRYNRALLQRAAALVRSGDWATLMADAEPRRPVTSPAPRLAAGPLGLMIRF